VPRNALFCIVSVLFCTACSTALPPEMVVNPAIMPSAPPTTQRDAANAELVMYAMSLADTPYLYGSQSPNTGFDCSGLVLHVFQQTVQVNLPRTSLEMSQAGRGVGLEELQPGDLVFYNTQQRDFSHVGIYVGEHKFVHAPKTGSQVKVANMRENYWLKRYNGARRISF
jgi:cell wall-associated NlpC family hydrolase